VVRESILLGGCCCAWPCRTLLAHVGIWIQHICQQQRFRLRNPAHDGCVFGAAFLSPYHAGQRCGKQHENFLNGPDDIMLVHKVSLQHRCCTITCCTFSELSA
jgi:hypothetical protein